MGKLLATGFALVAFITLLIVRQALTPEAPVSTAKAVKASPSQRYQAPDNITHYQRPSITIDEKKTNRRWVQSIDKSSLRGTQVDRAQLQTDKNGIVKLAPGILTYFDYFLSLRGEMSLQRIEQMVYDDIYAHYSAPANDQLYDLFKRYLAYSDAMKAYLDTLTYADVAEQGLTPQSVQQQFQVQYFSSEEIQNLFSAYDKMFDFQPQSRELSTKLDEYDNTPAEDRLAKATELFGAETANRLQQLEQKRALWKKRLQQYDKQKQAILAANMDAYNQKVAIQSLLDQQFSPSEQVSVHTWEHNKNSP